MALDEQAAAFTKRLHFWARNACNQSAVILSADKLGIFEVLRKGSPSVEAIATSVNCSTRGVRALIELLLAMGHAHRASTISLDAQLASVFDDATVRLALENARNKWHLLEHLDREVLSGVGDGISHLADCLAVKGRTEAGTAFLRQAIADGALTAVLLAAGRLGLLEALANGPRPPDQLLKDASPARLLGLLQALQVMEIASVDGAGWQLSPVARQVLDEKNLAYFVRTLPVSAEYWKPLEQLDVAVREEKYLLDLKDPTTCARFYSENARQITAVFASHFQLSRQAAVAVSKVKSLANAQVLDIGTGSGVWGAGIAHTVKDAHVSYFDQASVLVHTRANLERLKLADRASLIEGDCLKADFGESRWDLVILPQVLNVLLPKDLPGLFKRIARALKPDGLLMIAEYVLDEDREGPIDYLYFGLRRFMTNEGDLFSHGEYRAMLAPLGLTETRLFPLTAQELIVAGRPGAQLPSL